jgi:FG-GAP-like repeat
VVRDESADLSQLAAGNCPAGVYACDASRAGDRTVHASAAGSDLRRFPELQNNVWPADFNRDGKTDLVAGPRVGYLVVRLGNGDGTFGAEGRIPIFAKPLGVGDFNRDGRIDILATGTESPSVAEGLWVIPGQGNGTFRAPILVDRLVSTFGLVADLNRDGKRDIVVGEEAQSLHIYPGNGDFTFSPRHTLTTGAFPHGGVAADFNADGSPDIAVAPAASAELDIFINKGGLLFAPSVIPLSRTATDATVADLNGDGRRDLVVSLIPPDIFSPPFEDGSVAVLLGKGDGSFAASVEYATAPGPLSVVVGDFNRDGRTDVATGNQSWREFDCLSYPFHLWDSVSVLAGTGTGTLLAPTSFSLGRQDQNGPEGETYRGTFNSLNTSDVNGDGHTDLISSPGAILLNTGAHANRTPRAFAGPDQYYFFGPPVILDGEGGDADEDRLSFTWTDSTGRSISTLPDPCVASEPGVYTYTLTVDDGNGGIARDGVTIHIPEEGVNPFIQVTSPGENEAVQAGTPFTIRWSVFPDPRIARVIGSFSTDNGRTFTPIPGCATNPFAADCRWTNPGPLTNTARVRMDAKDAAGATLSFHVSDRFRIVSGPGTVPFAFALPGTDIGAVGVGGGGTFDGTTLTVRGSGSDIWGTADAFHWAYRFPSGDFEITARVLSVENIDQWTKAGLMIREGGLAGARHVSLFATPTDVKGVAFQRRLVTNGASVHTPGPSVAPPVWLKLVRRGDVVYAYSRKTVNNPWTLVGTQTFAAANNSAIAAIVVSSHDNTRLAAAKFDNVSFWTSEDIFSDGRVGSTSSDGITTTIEGDGADIWGTADGFRFHYTPWVGDGTITVRVRSLENTDAWAKAGVMFRESLSSNSKHVMAIVSPGKGLAMQYRSATEGESRNAGLRAGTAPEWLRLVRAGDVFTGYASQDGITWVTLGTVTILMDRAVLVGLPVTSHKLFTLSTAIFDNVIVRR